MPPRKKKVTKKRPAQKTPDPLTLIIYAPSGNGKTSFAAQFPNCGFICDTQERGAYFLSQRNLIPQPVWLDMDYPSSFPRDDSDRITSGGDVWKRLLDRIWKAARDDSINTLVLETVTGIETIGFVHHAVKHYQGQMSGKKGFFSYMKGPTEFTKEGLPQFVDALDAVWQAGKTAILTAHSRIQSEESPEGMDIQKHVPYADKKTWPILHRWACAVFFIGRRVEKDERAKGLRDKARHDVHDRLLYVEGTPYVDAKNWLGLTGMINLGRTPHEGYQNFLKELER